MTEYLIHFILPENTPYKQLLPEKTIIYTSDELDRATARMQKFIDDGYAITGQKDRLEKIIELAKSIPAISEKPKNDQARLLLEQTSITNYQTLRDYLRFIHAKAK